MPALNKESRHLFLNEINRSNSARQLIYNLFHSEYDDKIEKVVYLCRESTKSLLPHFEDKNFRNRLNSAILHTIRLILTVKNKFLPNRCVKYNVRFFTNVMRNSFNEQDYQTAHMLWLVLTHPAIANLNLKKNKKNTILFEEIDMFYGKPMYKKHIKYWNREHTANTLPSLIAFDTYITRNEFMGFKKEAMLARELLQIYKYMNYEWCPLLPIYNQGSMTWRQQKQLSKYLMK
jgi:hypothetical protein